MKSYLGIPSLTDAYRGSASAGISLNSSVGKLAANQPEDVQKVQLALSQFRPDIPISGIACKKTIATIVAYQQLVVRSSVADGRIDRNGFCLYHLNKNQNFISLRDHLSGKDWLERNQHRLGYSKKLDELEPKFRENVKKFFKALAEAGASTPLITTTFRTAERSYVMHYAHKIAIRGLPISEAKYDDRIRIIWDHGNDTASKKAAAEMNKEFGTDPVNGAALKNSGHNNRNAIDVWFHWDQTIKIKYADGKKTETLKPGYSHKPTKMWDVGASYGVHKLASDKPHWSASGK